MTDPVDKRFQDRTKTLQFKLPEAACAEEERSARRAFLTVIRGGGADLGRTALVDALAEMGRDPACALALTDPGVSWRHARIKRSDGDCYLLEDSGSTNGTRVNGRLVQGGWPLSEGEKIFLGETVVRFGLADELELGFQQEVAQLVGTDPLTGLESKRRFDDALDRALAVAGESETPLTVLMMDMDGVKQINDTHGHLFGAHCIGEAGRIIGRQIGRRGHACRFGGDEFTAFLPGVDKAGAWDLAEQIRLAIDQAGLTKDGVALHPTISIGLASFPQDARKVLDLIAAADTALYRAKARGKNTVSD